MKIVIVALIFFVEVMATEVVSVRKDLTELESTYYANYANGRTETIQGELFSQEIDDSSPYGITTYILTSPDEKTEYNVGTENYFGTTLKWFYTFKVLNGQELILGQYYIFKAVHIENGEFIVKEIQRGK